MSLLALISVAGGAAPVTADEGGVGFYLPGSYASFAAVPSDPGWSLPLVYYHLEGDLGADKNFVIGGQVTSGIDATGDLVFAFPTYVLHQLMWGGQAGVSVGWAVGTMNVSVDATLTGAGGSVIARNVSDGITGGSDLYPEATLRWNRGTNNYLAYVMAGVPVGIYEKGSLANLGTNHWSIDGGGGYTYLNPKNGRELSAVLGFTHNFENPDTHYRNGLDSHLEWGVSQFLSETNNVGAAGYFYYQLTGDTGDGAVLGDFKSQVIGAGPQLSHFFVVGGNKWVGQAKAYWEFDARNRAAGWNLWLVLEIPLGSKPKG